jgi:signal transduction histidine kinase
VRIRIVDAPPDRVRFEISDRGPGMPEHVIESVLGEGGGRRNHPAGGQRSLGLTIAKAIVDRHSGHFGIMSEPGQGTEVFMSFPSATAP